MKTRVKRNANEARDVTKPSHIECMAQFSPINSNGKYSSSREHPASIRVGITLNQYLSQREQEFRYYLFGGL